MVRVERPWDRFLEAAKPQLWKRKAGAALRDRCGAALALHCDRAVVVHSVSPVWVCSYEGRVLFARPSCRYGGGRELSTGRDHAIVCDPSGAHSSAVEHYLDMVGVTGSIPVAPTTSPRQSGASEVLAPRVVRVP